MEKILESFYTCINQIASFNSNCILNSKNSQQDVPDDLLFKCLSSNYYNPCNFRTKTNVFRSIVSNDIYTNQSLCDPSSINISSFLKSATPDRFYIAHHTTEAVHHGDEFLPNRNKLTVSYSWKSIFYLPLLRGQKPVSKIIKDLFIRLSIPDKESSEDVRFDLSLTGSSENPLTSIFFSLNAAEAKQCLARIVSSPYSINGVELPLMCIQRRASKKKSSSSYTPVSATTKTPRNYILFIDSMDYNLLSSGNLSSKYPSIDYLWKNSLLFKNFTASADWTYPCLHSMHTGVSPHLSLSFSRLSTYTNFCDLDFMHSMVIKTSNPGLFFARHSNVNPWLKHKTISALIDQYGFSQVALNSSPNHCRSSNFTPFIPLSVEGISPPEVTECLRKIMRAYKRFEINTIFLDLDHFHMTSPSAFANLMSGVSPASSFFQRPTKQQRLSGDSAFLAHEKDVYSQRAVMVDISLNEILEFMQEGDKLLLFSDHGSIWSDTSHLGKYSTIIPDDSNLKLNKMLNPSLLLYEHGKEDGKVVDDIVMTQDLYSIIAYMHGINVDSYLSSRLPECLGGSSGRKSSCSFGTVRTGNANYYDCLLRNQYGEFEYYRSSSQASVKLRSDVSSHSYMMEMFGGLEFDA